MRFFIKQILKKNRTRKSNFETFYSSNLEPCLKLMKIQMSSENTADFNQLLTKEETLAPIQVFIN